MSNIVKKSTICINFSICFGCVIYLFLNVFIIPVVQFVVIIITWKTLEITLLLYYILGFVIVTTFVMLICHFDYVFKDFNIKTLFFLSILSLIGFFSLCVLYLFFPDFFSDCLRD